MDPPPEESVSSTPPSSVFDSVPGYEKMLLECEGGCVHPPELSEQHHQPEPQPSCPNWDLPALSKDDAQQAFIKYASEKCCYSTKPAKDGVITNMEDFSTYRYHLETFTETRHTKWSETPHFGGPIDHRGQTPPGPWEIPVRTPPFFQDGKQIIEVPYTSSVKDCRRCSTTGKISCPNCYGMGTITCSGCSGFCYFTNYSTGLRQPCFSCGGRGRTSCYHCHGSRFTQCPVCLGQRKVEVCINLVVNWLNNIDKHTVEQSSGLKMSKLDTVTGTVLFTDSNHMVYPITNFPDPKVVQTSELLVKEHRDKYLQTSCILQQRQTIERLPITKVTYEWRKESHVFYVYGSDLKVSAEDYPAACCCCCCTVM